MKQSNQKTGATETDDEVKDIAMEIAQYLERHPRSKDTLEGIRTWWLDKGTVPVSALRVKKALSWLIQNHVVVKEPLPDGGEIFASTKDVTSKIRAIN